MTAEPVTVCFVSPKAYPLFNDTVTGVFGGAEVDLYLLATRLARDPAWRVRMVVADYGQPPRETRQGVELIRSVDFRCHPLTGARRVWHALGQANADIYIQESASPGTGLVAAFCRRHRRRFVYRTASERECNGVYFGRSLLKGRWFLWALRQADQVIVQTDQQRRDLQRTTGLNAMVIPNGHILSEVDISAKERILWVGRSAPVKRPELFVQLARRLPDLSFTMICQKATGDDGYDRLVQQAARQPNLEFIDRVPFHLVDRYYQSARLLVCTSLSEGFPNSYLQAAKSAAAILSLKVNPDEFLTRCRCGICCQDDFETLVSECRALCREPDRWRQMGLNGQRYIRQHHDLERLLDRYCALFTRLVRPECR